MELVRDYGETFNIEIEMNGAPVKLKVQRVDDFWRVTFEDRLVVDAYLNNIWHQASSIHINEKLFNRITAALDEHFTGI